MGGNPSNRRMGQPHQKRQYLLWNLVFYCWVSPTLHIYLCFVTFVRFVVNWGSFFMSSGYAKLRVLPIFTADGPNFRRMVSRADVRLLDAVFSGVSKSPIWAGGGTRLSQTNRMR